MEIDEQKSEPTSKRTGSVRVQLSSTLEYEAVERTSRQILAMANLKAPFFETQSRAPINLIAVMDRSGSMEGEKIRLVKETLNFVITQLRNGDTFSLVTFESDVETNLAVTKMNTEGKEIAKKKISGISVGGCTNLSGGLFAGLDLIPKSSNEKEITSVLLLTDGLANVGITDSTQLTDAIKKQIEEKPAFTLFTFGYGADHDDKMLKAISETSKGLYYFIENADHIPKAFGDCIGGLISVVAQNMKLRLEPLSGVVIKQVKTKFKVSEEVGETGETIHEVNLGDLYSEEERNIVCELELPEVSDNILQSKILVMRLNYFNVLSSESEKQETVTQIDRQDNVPQLTPNISVDKQRNRMIAADALEKANALGRSSQLQQARNELNQAISQLKNSVSANEQMSLQLVTDLQEALSRIQDQSTYASSGSKYMSSHSMSHHYQRSSHTTPMYTTYTKYSSMTNAEDQVNQEDE